MKGLIQIGFTRILLIILSILALGLIYITQLFDYSGLFFAKDTLNPDAQFILNRVTRYILNDLSVILLLWALFQDRGLIKVAFGIQILGLFVILPIYFWLKLTLEGPSEESIPLLSFIHRITVNPILLVMLIPAKFFKDWKEK